MPEIKPPVAPLKDHTVLFGKVEGENRGANPIDPPIRRTDPYFWLRDDERQNPEVLAHLQNEKAYYEASMQDLKELSSEIYEEHLSHIEETDMSPPYVHGPFIYYRRNAKGKAYLIYCRVPVGKTPGDVTEEVLLDVNALAEGKSYCHVLSVEPAPPKHELIAYSLDWTGNEIYTIQFQPNAQGISDKLTNTDGDFVWSNDGSSIFYITKDESLRSNKIWCHMVGRPQSEDVCLYTEDDPIFSISILTHSVDHTCSVMSVSAETTEVYLLDLRGGSQPKELDLVRRREKGVKYSVRMHGHDTLVILTDEGGAVNNKVVLASRSNPSHWHTVLVPHCTSCYYEDILVLEKFLLVSGRSEGLSAIWLMLPMRGDNGKWEFGAGQSELRLQRFSDEPVYTVSISGDQPMRAFECDTYRVKYSSLTTPDTWVDVNAVSGEQRVVKRKEVGGGFRREDYVVERRFGTAPDGAQIPISLVYLKQLDRSQPQACLLYGYGSYGLCMEPSFSVRYLPYLDRGIIYAIAHIRGGSELGRNWHKVGAKYLTKRNTFSDFIAAAESLIVVGVTTPGQLACEGRSAGGLLIGAVLNMRPDLFQVALAGVPFVDVMTTMCDPSIPLTTGEWEEWGNPNEYKFFDYMLSYSPVDNVRAQRYPNLLVQAGLHDPRVAYWEPAKWVAKLRAHKTNDSEILFDIDLESGHFSASDRYKYWKEHAPQQAFVCKHLRSVMRLLKR